MSVNHFYPPRELLTPLVRTNRFLFFLSLVSLVASFALGAQVARRRTVVTVWTYDPQQLRLISRGDHSPSDRFINHALACEVWGYNDLALQQIDIVITHDSAYWPAWSALGTIRYNIGQIIPSIKPFSRSLELNHNDSVFVVDGGFTFSNQHSFFALANAYAHKYTQTNDEYCAYFAELCANSALEIDSTFEFNLQLIKLIKWLHDQHSHSPNDSACNTP